MSKLFQKEFFDEVIAALNNPDRKEAVSAFQNVAHKAELTPKQTAWLWNYLRNYNEELAWNQSTPKNGW